MAKKKTGKGQVDELNFDDLDDLDTSAPDFGDLDDVDSEDRNPSKAGIAKELAKEAGTGFLDGLVTNTAKKALPEAYSENYYELMDYADFAKNTFDVQKSKVSKSMYRLGKEVKKLLPFQFKALDSYLEKFEGDFEEVRQQSEEAMREASTASAVADIFDKQLDFQKAVEAKRDAEGQAEARERITTNKLNFDVMRSIEQGVSTQTAFTLQVSKEFFRKSLELQFKSFYVQADMLKVMRDHYKGFSVQLDEVVKNTGLPEFVKLNNTERISDIIRTQSVQGIYDKLFTNSKYVEGIKKKMGGLIDEKVSGFTDRIDEVTDQLGMLNSAGEMGGGGAGIMGSVLSGLFGSTIGEKLSEKISPKLKEKIKDNKVINAGGNYMGMLGTSPSTFFEMLKNKTGKKAEEYSDEGDPLRFAASKMFGGLNSLFGVTDPGKPEVEMKGQSILAHNKPAIFDNKVHRSITEVIPMYLAKILRESTDMVRMYRDINKGKLSKAGSEASTELLYDYEGRDLVTAEKLRENVEKNVLATSEKKSRVSGITTTLLSMSENELKKAGDKDGLRLLNNKKTKKLMDEYLTKLAAKEGMDFSYENIIGEAGTGKNADVDAILKENPDLAKVLELLKKSTANRQDFQIDERMKDVSRAYPITGVKKLFSDTSKLAGRKILNVLTDDKATAIAKMFIRYQLNEGKDIGIDVIIDGNAFGYADVEEVKIVTEEIQVFCNDVYKINALDDTNMTSSLWFLLGVCNSSLRTGADVSPDVYQILLDYSPALGKKGDLKEEQLYERKLFSNADNRLYIDAEAKRNLVKLTPETKAAAEQAVNERNLTSSFGSLVSRVSEELKATNGNYLQMGRILVREIKTAAKEIEGRTKKQYEKATASIGKFKDLVATMTDDKIQESLGKFVTRLTKAAETVDGLIKSETDAKQDALKLLQQNKEAYSSTVSDPSGLADIERSIRFTTKYYDSEIAALRAMHKQLLEKANTLARMKIDLKNKATDLKVTDVVKFVREEIQDLLNSLHETLQKAKQSEEIADEVATA